MAGEQKGCLGMLLSLFGGAGDSGSSSSTGAGGDPPPVAVNRYFITAAEQSFFGVLKQVVGDRGHVLAQVSLRQLVYFPGSNKGTPGRAAWQNKVAQRPVDFVVVDARTLRPLVAFELDDPTHATPKRQDRDEDVARVLEAAGLPLLRILASRAYDTREIAEALAPHLRA